MRTPLAFPPPPSLPSLAPPRATGRVGRAFAGYDVVRRLGASATSEVLLAVSRGPLGFERTVVLKRLLLEDTGDASSLARARLGREALAYARLAHPAVVRLYDFVEDDGRLTLVLEHVDGLSLARVLSGLRACGEHLDEQAVWYVGYRLFQALAAAHAARDPMTREFAPVIHRDVSPANVLVPWDGYVKLTDFGVARLAGVAGDTRPGVVNGTVGYLAPEQVRGEPATVRTDVYGACLILRELLLHAPAFPRGQESELALLGAMAEPKLVPLAELRPALQPSVAHAIDRGLSPDAEARSITADEMVALLRSAAGDVETARERLIEKIARLRRREDASARSVAYATRPDGEAGERSLFEESATTLDDETQLETETATAPAYAQRRDSQEKITTRPPPPALPPPGPVPPGRSLSPPPLPARATRTPPSSMVVPRAQPVVAWNPAHPSAILPIAPPPETARMVEAPPVPARAPSPPASLAPPPPVRGGFASRTSSALIVETPNVMTTAVEPEPDHAGVGSARDPARRSALLIVAAAAAVGMGVLIGGVLGLRERASASQATNAARSPSHVPAAGTTALATAPASPPPSPAPAPSPTLAASSTPASAPSPVPARASALPPGTGRLVTHASEKGHRIFLDGRLAGSGGAALVVRCGRHDVRVGSAGRLRKVEVPCGGDVEVSR